MVSRVYRLPAMRERYPFATSEEIVMIRILLGLVAFSVTGSAWAITDPETEQKFPDTSTCGAASAKAAGVGVREKAWIDVYAVVIYAGPKAQGKSLRSASGCVKIRARFVRSVGVDKIKDAWLDGFKKFGLAAGDATVKKFLSVVSKEMKKGSEMVITINGGTVVHRYMGASTKVTSASKLGAAIKKIYLSGSSPAPSLVKDLEKRGVAKP